MDDKEATAALPAIGMSYKVGLGDGKELVFQTHVPQNVEPAEMDALIDKLRDAADRQAAFSDLVELEKVLEQQTTAMLAAEEQKAKIDADYSAKWKASGKRGEIKLTGAERNALDNFEKSRQGFLSMIGRVQAQIDKTKAKIGG